MNDWVWFGSLAFPAFSRTALLGSIIWFALRYAYRRFSLDRWFWHSGLVELSLLVISYAFTSWILSL
ncbi:DUF1656 domain-containing protein [Endozoicomonas sp. SCSIO W0465]|uniref:DUF1656 domain-containing protein n=1 Tax=Endozoicomonas sp. SCSIO W0465 TaxID=2918516 RepID=UPI0035320FF7